MLSGGGTGGHVYPLLTVVDELHNRGRLALLGELELLYLGSEGSIEEQLCRRYGVPFRAIAAGALRGASPLTALKNAARSLAGLAQSWRIVGQFRPDVTLVTGGYVSVPVVLATRLRGRPALVYLPDIVPGLAVRMLAHLAEKVAVSFPETVAHFAPGKAVVTGYPVRRQFYAADKTEARQRLALDPHLPALLVLGGSRGAHSINAAVAENLAPLLNIAQVIHMTGAGDIDEMTRRREALPPTLRARYHPHAYLHEELIDAMAAADLVIARAGAATLGEFPAVGVPSILVPYPYSGQHQEPNADYMVQHGAARKVADSELPTRLLPLVEELLGQAADGTGTRSVRDEMQRQARALARPNAAHNIVKLLLEYAPAAERRAGETAPAEKGSAK